MLHASTIEMTPSAVEMRRRSTRGSMFCADTVGEYTSTKHASISRSVSTQKHSVPPVMPRKIENTLSPSPPAMTSATMPMQYTAICVTLYPT